MKQYVVFYKNSKSKNSDDPTDDTFAKEYFKEHSVNLYIKKLLGCSEKKYLTNGDIEKLKESYEKAHDIRKFEIDLYWKRTTYIWTLIAALFTACVLLAAAYYRVHDVEPIKDKALSETRNFLLATLAGVSFFGVVITIASSFILKSGEYWQKNWEYHVNLLEPLFSGRLYATLLDRNTSRYSISGLNNFLYWVFLLLWLIIFAAIDFVFFKDFSFFCFFIPIVIFGAIIIFVNLIISRVTCRTSCVSKISISQWGVEISENTNNKDINDSPFNLKLDVGLKLLKIIALVFLIYIFGIIIYHSIF